MGRIDTGGVVAVGAVVAHQQAIRDRPVGKLIRESMRPQVTPLNLQVAVTAIKCGPSPQPATVRLLDLAPELRFKGDALRHIMLLAMPSQYWYSDIIARRGGPMKRTELRLPDAMYAQLIALAKQERRSLNQQITILLEEAMKHKREART
jgi:hypothetical protein